MKMSYSAVSSLAVAACATGCFAQAMLPTANTMALSGNFTYSLNGNPTAFGNTSNPSVLPTPGDYGLYEDGYTWGGASWSTRIAAGWTLSNTPTTTDVSGYLNLYGSADQGQSGAIVQNASTASISFAFTTTQPVSYSANWYTTIFGPVFSTGAYGVYGAFSPYPNSPMSGLSPMSNSGTLSPGFHSILLILDLNVIVPPSISINDGIGVGFDLHTQIIPAPGAAVILGLGSLVATRRRR